MPVEVVDETIWSRLEYQEHLSHYPLKPSPLDKMAAILADNIFKCISLNEYARILIQI